MDIDYEPDILQPRDQEIGEFDILQEFRATNSKAQKWRKDQEHGAKGTRKIIFFKFSLCP